MSLPGGTLPLRRHPFFPSSATFPARILSHRRLPWRGPPEFNRYMRSCISYRINHRHFATALDRFPKVIPPSIPLSHSSHRFSALSLHRNTSSFVYFVLPSITNWKECDLLIDFSSVDALIAYGWQQFLATGSSEWVRSNSGFLEFCGVHDIMLCFVN